MISRDLIETTPVIALPGGRFDSVNAARYLGCSSKTLAMMRCKGTGPRFIKRGRIFYYQDDLDGWLNAGGRVASTAQAKNRKEASEGSQK